MIYFVTRKWPPAIGGMETYSIKLCEALRQYDSVKVIALPGRSDGSPPSAISLCVFGFRTAAALLANRAPHGTVHIADMALWPLAFVAGLRSRRWRIALSAHGTDVSYPRRGGIKGRLYGTYLRLGGRLLRQAVVVANSAATGDCARIYGFPHVVVSPLATDMRPANPYPEVERFVLFAGRLVERKGCGWFIRNVLPELPQDITLKVAGTVWSKSESAALCHPRVDYIGPRSPEEIAGLYASATCVVVPNIDVPNGEIEGFGLVATEASAAGGVPVAAAHTGLHEAVIDGGTGFLLRAGDAQQWIVKITEISQWSRAARSAFVERSIRTTQEHYRWDRVALETLEAYGMAATADGIPDERP